MVKTERAEKPPRILETVLHRTVMGANFQEGARIPKGLKNSRVDLPRLTPIAEGSPQLDSVRYVSSSDTVTSDETVAFLGYFSTTRPVDGKVSVVVSRPAPTDANPTRAERYIVGTVPENDQSLTELERYSGRRVGCVVAVGKEVSVDASARTFAATIAPQVMELETNPKDLAQYPSGATVELAGEITKIDGELGVVTITAGSRTYQVSFRGRNVSYRDGSPSFAPVVIGQDMQAGDVITTSVQVQNSLVFDDSRPYAARLSPERVSDLRLNASIGHMESLVTEGTHFPEARGLFGELLLSALTPDQMQRIVQAAQLMPDEEQPMVIDAGFVDAVKVLLGSSGVNIATLTRDEFFRQAPPVEINGYVYDPPPAGIAVDLLTGTRPGAIDEQGNALPIGTILYLLTTNHGEGVIIPTLIHSLTEKIATIDHNHAVSDIAHINSLMESLANVKQPEAALRLAGVFHTVRAEINADDDVPRETRQSYERVIDLSVNYMLVSILGNPEHVNQITKREGVPTGTSGDFLQELAVYQRELLGDTDSRNSDPSYEEVRRNNLTMLITLVKTAEAGIDFERDRAAAAIAERDRKLRELGDENAALQAEVARLREQVGDGVGSPSGAVAALLGMQEGAHAPVPAIASAATVFDATTREGV